MKFSLEGNHRFKTMSLKRKPEAGSSPETKKLDIYHGEIDSQEDMFEGMSQKSFRSSVTLPSVSPEHPFSGSSNLSLPSVSDVQITPPTQDKCQDTHGYEYDFSSQSLSLPPVSDSQISSNTIFNSLPSVIEEPDPIFDFDIGTIFQEDIGSDPAKFHSVLCEATESFGLDTVVNAILDNEAIKNALVCKILKNAHNQMKVSLKHSILRANEQKKNREYLLSITPCKLCQELEELCPEFSTLLLGLLGVKDMSVVLESQHLMNITALLFSIFARNMNQQASGYAI